jgi:tetratricopeptide (TPR) repeat protein/predicted Ser/Thr protein kinase
MKCSQCGAPNLREDLECRRCGAPLLDALDAGGTAAHDTAAGKAATQVVATPGELTEGITHAVTPTPTAAMTPPEATVSDLGPTAVGAGKTAVPGQTSPDFEPTGSIYMTGQPSAPAPAVPMKDISPGSLFAGRYEVLALVGEGGMGKVYTARDRELDKVIALKTIRSDGGGDPDAVARFKQELLLARKVSHRNVVRIFDLGESEGVKFFTMEFIEGQSLKALIRKRGRVPAQETVAICRQVLAALHEAHSQGIIHRDLKPQNIMIDNAGMAHLMDFGIARSVDATGMTATGTTLGTPDYMSPEQVRGEKAGEPSDIFSFGVILYEMLTGDVPYHADTPISKIVMRLTQKPRPPHELSPDIPKNLEAVVQKCMEVDLALRYKNVGEIQADLDRGQVDRSLTMRVQRAVSQSRGTIAAVGVAALVVAGLVYWAVSRTPAGGGNKPPEVVRTLAIVPLTNATGSPEMEWLRTGLPDMLVTDLSQSKYVRPVPGERVFRVLEESGLEKQARFDEKALEAVSRLAHAESVLSGQFVEAGGRLRLDLNLRKAGSGVSVPLKVEGTAGEVFALVDQVAKAIKEQLDLSPDQLRADADRPISEVATASLDAQRAYQAAVAQIRKGANQDAVLLLEKATAVDPKFAMAQGKLAEALMSLGKTPEALAAADRAKTLAEQSPLPLAERYQIHAIAALVKEDNETAAQSYGELAKLYPDDPDVQMSLGRANEELGKLPEALAAFQRVVRAQPQYGSALLSLGRVQVKSCRAEEAIRSLQDALATKQFDGEPEALGMIHSVIGVAYRETGKLDKSLEHLSRSLEIRQKEGDKRGQGATLQNLATVYEYMGNPTKALDTQRKALALYREMGNKGGESLILNAMGQTYKDAGNLDKALLAFRDSMQIEMEREDHVNMANRLDLIASVYTLKGQYDDALVYLEQAKTHLAKTDEKKEKGINLEYVGLVRKAQGAYNEAVEAFLAALPLYKEIDHQMSVADVHRSLGAIYESQGRYADAFTAFQECVATYQKLHTEHDLDHANTALGHLYLSLGRPDDAEKAFKAAEGAGGHGDHHAAGHAPAILLGQAWLLEVRGKLDEAAAAYEKANVGANLSGQKEVAVESRIALGQLYRKQGKLANAEALLRRTREEATKARLRPLETDAAIALAEVLLVKGDAEGARRTAQEAATLAEKFSGKPAQQAALSAQGEALEKLGRKDEALDAFAKAAASLEWIRGSLKPEHVESYMTRAEVQAFLKEAVPRLQRGGRNAEAANLGRWLKPQAGA